MPAGKRGAGRAARRSRWTDIEREIRRSGRSLIAGVDEVGRGSLAGPVVACAVIMPPEARALRGVDDSKALPAPERRRLARLIRERAVALSLGAASVAEIDRLNIYQASALAMRRALERLAAPPDHVLVDGRPIRTLGIPHTAVVAGDDKCFSIACASIVAKVTRDRLMGMLAGKHPAYAWERNAGYATRAHIDALRERGASPHHRRTFLVKALSSQLDLALDADTLDAPPATSEDVVIDALLATQAGIVPAASIDA
ncbi:MAG TPA: ribonuclease HII [Gemmatimonadaceae bacterium]|nr:ribonuclease HII [Gemmatimonadaceae bacterium]